MKTQISYNPGLDGIRFFAVLSVMIAHWCGDINVLDFLVPYASYFAYSGVGLFFVLSGFLITRILLLAKDQEGSKTFILKNFYIRRFLRIFPLYYLVLFACLIVGLPDIKFVFPWLATYTANYIGAFYPNSMGHMSHFWSLCVEEQFYIFFPFVVLFIPKRHLEKTFFVLLTIGVASRIVCLLLFPKDVAGWATYIFTPCCFDCFAVGALAAYWYFYKKQYLKSISKHKVFFVCAGLFSIALYSLPVTGFALMLDSAVLRLTVALFSGWLIAIISLGTTSTWFNKILLSKPVVYLGKISYGLYVYHNFMPDVLRHVNIPHKTYLYPAVTLALSMLSFHLYEHPINNLKDKFKYVRKEKTATPLSPAK